LASLPRAFSPQRSATCWARSGPRPRSCPIAVRGGILVFVSGSDTATRQSTLLYGALFGLFCYATFDLTSLSLLKHWTWLVAVVDVCWGSFVTAMSLTAGLLIANRIAPLN
jgi:uncharacterized membrane protein